MITDLGLRLPWDDFPLELSDPEKIPRCQELIACLPHYSPPTILNRLLTREVPLRPCLVLGAIVAEGSTSVPAECHDDSLVTVELLLTDERRNDFCFEFAVRMDRSLKRNYERQHQELRERVPPTERTGMFGPKIRQVENQKNVSPKEAINLREASGEDDRKLRKPN